MLIVANKYQTGFDQPLLCAMYVNKRLAGVQAVQTLSRLNRTYADKQTFVLDFVNDREHILKCFADYYEHTTTADDVDPQRLYTLRSELESVDVLRNDEIDAVAELVSKPRRQHVAQDNAQLHSLLDPAVDRFGALDEDQAERFRDRLDAYCRLYGFLGQVVPFCDFELEKLYLYGKELVRKLRSEDLSAPPVDLSESVGLRYYQLAKVGEGALTLAADSGEGLRGPTSTGTGRIERQQDSLSNLIERMNARFATEFDEVQDLVDGLGARLLDDDQLRLAAQTNDEDNFAHKFDPRLEGEMMDRYAEFAPFLDRLFSDDELLGFFRAQMRKQIYEQLRGT